MRLLLTRPRQDSVAFAEKLAALGHEAVIAPVIEIVHCNTAISLQGVQALLATSANGIRAFADACSDRALPVFAVGPQTAECAREADFGEVISANGDSVALTS